MSRKSKILFVDDELSALESYQELFSDSFRVLVASSFEKALAILSRVDVKILITDMRMPHQDGEALLTLANQKFRKPIKFMLSAYVDSFFDDQFQNRCKPYAILRKPIRDTEEFLNSLREAEREYDFRYPSTEGTQQFLNVTELLGRLRISRPSLYKHLKRGLPSKTIGGRRLFDWAEVLLWIDTHGNLGSMDISKGELHG